MTEDEAKTKWCPMTRYRTIKAVPMERDSIGLSNLPTGEGKCIASDCMMWRYEHPEPASAGECGLKQQ